MKVCLIVEGLNDEYQIINAFKNFEGGDRVKCIVTGGTKVDNRILTEIEYYRRNEFDIFVLSDPDEAGNQLYHMIKHFYPDIPRIMADKQECAYYTGKKFKAGVEYSSYDYLRKIICPLIGVDYTPKENPVCWENVEGMFDRHNK